MFQHWFFPPTYFSGGYFGSPPAWMPEPTPLAPAGGNNGTADTAARSDHTHEGLGGSTTFDGTLDDVPDGNDRFAATQEDFGDGMHAYFGGVPAMSYMRHRNILDLTKHFGTNNLTMDGAETGGGTDDRAKLQNIRDSLHTSHPNGQVELYAPPKRLARLSKGIYWDVDYTYFAGDGFGFVCDLANGTDRCGSSVFILGTNASANYIGTKVSERLLSLTEIPKGATDIPIPLLQDYVALNDIDRIMVMSPYWGLDVTDQLVHPSRIRVFDAKKIGNQTIRLNRPMPFPITLETNPNTWGGAWPAKRADGSTISGIPFRILREGPVADWIADDVPGGKELNVWGTEFHGVRLISINGHIFMGFAVEGVVADSDVSAGRGVWYFNNGTNALFRNNRCEFGSHTWECSMATNCCLFEDNRYYYRGTSAVSTKWMAGDKEYASNNTRRNERIYAPTYNPAETIFRALLCDGADNTYDGMEIMVGYNGGGFRPIEVVPAWGPDAYSGSRNSFRGIRVGTAATVSSAAPPIVCQGDDNRFESVTFFYGAGSPNNAGINILGDRTFLSDINEETFASQRNLTFAAGTSGGTARRCAFNVTDNGSNTIIAGTPLPGNLQR